MPQAAGLGCTNLIRRSQLLFVANIVTNCHLANGLWPKSSQFRMTGCPATYQPNLTILTAPSSSAAADLSSDINYRALFFILSL